MKPQAAPSPFDPDALERAVPRYTSYPTQPHFAEAVGPRDYRRWLGEIEAERALRLYIHVPFCRSLCWYCACRTQGVGRYAAVGRYVDALAAEAARVAEALGPPRRMVEVAFGGGSPTTLSPGDLRRLHRALGAAFAGMEEAAFRAEIDPRDLSEPLLDALAECGVSEVSIGVQDVDPRVQAAIGRRQDHAATCRAVELLRGRGVRRLTMDILYGLPEQSLDTLSRTVEAVVALAPERIALYGYAHVPWLARRQTMIDESALPQGEVRRAQAAHARALILAAGYEAVGIDHFVRPGDPLHGACRAGRLERGFEGYRVADGAALIGLGASAIGALPQGYVQNEPGTAPYLRQIEAGGLATRRGHALSLDDRIRRAAVFQILCAGALDLDALTQRFGDFVKPISEAARRLTARAPAGSLVPWRGGFRVAPDWIGHARLIAAEFDAYLAKGGARHSLVI